MDGEINTLIDFELELLAFLHEEKQPVAYPIVRYFFQAYQAIRQLSQAELLSIPMFVKVAHMWLIGISASVVEDVLAYGWFTEDWLDARLAMLKTLDDV